MVSVNNFKFHLRRIGPQSTRDESADLMCFSKPVTFIGRNPTQVDFVISSSNFVQNAIISRRHARVIRSVDERSYRLFDDSRNGVFVNNTKISGSVLLSEGDCVTFGHPVGEKLQPETWVRQPDSEYQFVFERCGCPLAATKDIHSDNLPQARIEQPLFAAGLMSESSGTSKVTQGCVTTSVQESLVTEANFRAPAPVAGRSRHLKRLSCKLDVPEDHLNETISSPCISSATKCMENSNQSEITCPFDSDSMLTSDSVVVSEPPSDAFVCNLSSEVIGHVSQPGCSTSNDMLSSDQNCTDICKFENQAKASLLCSDQNLVISDSLQESFIVSSVPVCSSESINDSCISGGFVHELGEIVNVLLPGKNLNAADCEEVDGSHVPIGGILLGTAGINVSVVDDVKSSDMSQFDAEKLSEIGGKFSVYTNNPVKLCGHVPEEMIVTAEEIQNLNIIDAVNGAEINGDNNSHLAVKDVDISINLNSEQNSFQGNGAKVYEEDKMGFGTESNAKECFGDQSCSIADVRIEGSDVNELQLDVVEECSSDVHEEINLSDGARADCFGIDKSSSYDIDSVILLRHDNQKENGHKINDDLLEHSVKTAVAVEEKSGAVDFFQDINLETSVETKGLAEVVGHNSFIAEQYVNDFGEDRPFATLHCKYDSTTLRAEEMEYQIQSNFLSADLKLSKQHSEQTDSADAFDANDILDPLLKHNNNFQDEQKQLMLVNDQILVENDKWQDKISVSGFQSEIESDDICTKSLEIAGKEVSEGRDKVAYMIDETCMDSSGFLESKFFDDVCSEGKLCDDKDNNLTSKPSLNLIQVDVAFEEKPAFVSDENDNRGTVEEISETIISREDFETEKGTLSLALPGTDILTRSAIIAEENETSCICLPVAVCHFEQDSSTSEVDDQHNDNKSSMATPSQLKDWGGNDCGEISIETKTEECLELHVTDGLVSPIKIVNSKVFEDVLNCSKEVCSVKELISEEAVADVSIGPNQSVTEVFSENVEEEIVSCCENEAETAVPEVVSDRSVAANDLALKVADVEDDITGNLLFKEVEVHEMLSEEATSAQSVASSGAVAETVANDSTKALTELLASEDMIKNSVEFDEKVTDDLNVIGELAEISTPLECATEPIANIVRSEVVAEFDNSAKTATSEVADDEGADSTEMLTFKGAADMEDFEESPSQKIEDECVAVNFPLVETDLETFDAADLENSAVPLAMVSEKTSIIRAQNISKELVINITTAAFLGETSTEVDTAGKAKSEQKTGAERNFVESFVKEICVNDAIVEIGVIEKIVACETELGGTFIDEAVETNELVVHEPVLPCENPEIEIVDRMNMPVVKDDAEGIPRAVDGVVAVASVEELGVSSHCNPQGVLNETVAADAIAEKLALCGAVVIETVLDDADKTVTVSSVEDMAGDETISCNAVLEEISKVPFESIAQKQKGDADKTVRISSVEEMAGDETISCNAVLEEISKVSFENFALRQNTASTGSENAVVAKRNMSETKLVEDHTMNAKAVIPGLNVVAQNAVEAVSSTLLSISQPQSEIDVVQSLLAGIRGSVVPGDLLLAEIDKPPPRNERGDYDQKFGSSDCGLNALVNEVTDMSSDVTVDHTESVINELAAICDVELDKSCGDHVGNGSVGRKFSNSTVCISLSFADLSGIGSTIVDSSSKEISCSNEKDYSFQETKNTDMLENSFVPCHSSTPLAQSRTYEESNFPVKQEDEDCYCDIQDQMVMESDKDSTLLQECANEKNFKALEDVTVTPGNKDPSHLHQTSAETLDESFGNPLDKESSVVAANEASNAEPYCGKMSSRVVFDAVECDESKCKMLPTALISPENISLDDRSFGTICITEDRASGYDLMNSNILDPKKVHTGELMKQPGSCLNKVKVHSSEINLKLPETQKTIIPVKVAGQDSLHLQLEASGLHGFGKIKDLDSLKEVQILSSPIGTSNRARSYKVNTCTLGVTCMKSEYAKAANEDVLSRCHDFSFQSGNAAPDVANTHSVVEGQFDDVDSDSDYTDIPETKNTAASVIYGSLAAQTSEYGSVGHQTSPLAVDKCVFTSNITNLNLSPMPVVFDSRKRKLSTDCEVGKKKKCLEIVDCCTDFALSSLHHNDPQNYSCDPNVNLLSNQPSLDSCNSEKKFAYHIPVESSTLVESESILKINEIDENKAEVAGKPEIAEKSDIAELQEEMVMMSEEKTNCLLDGEIDMFPEKRLHEWEEHETNGNGVEDQQLGRRFEESITCRKDITTLLKENADSAPEEMADQLNVIPKRSSEFPPEENEIQTVDTTSEENENRMIAGATLEIQTDGSDTELVVEKVLEAEKERSLSVNSFEITGSQLIHEATMNMEVRLESLQNTEISIDVKGLQLLPPICEISESGNEELVTLKKDEITVTMKDDQHDQLKQFADKEMSKPHEAGTLKEMPATKENDILAVVEERLLADNLQKTVLVMAVEEQFEINMQERDELNKIEVEDALGEMLGENSETNVETLNAKEMELTNESVDFVASLTQVKCLLTNGEEAGLEIISEVNKEMPFVEYSHEDNEKDFDANERNSEALKDPSVYSDSIQMNVDQAMAVTNDLPPVEAKEINSNQKCSSQVKPFVITPSDEVHEGELRGLVFNQTTIYEPNEREFADDELSIQNCANEYACTEEPLLASSVLESDTTRLSQPLPNSVTSYESSILSENDRVSVSCDVEDRNTRPFTSTQTDSTDEVVKNLASSPCAVLSQEDIFADLMACDQRTVSLDNASEIIAPLCTSETKCDLSDTDAESLHLFLEVSQESSSQLRHSQQKNFRTLRQENDLVSEDESSKECYTEIIQEDKNILLEESDKLQELNIGSIEEPQINTDSGEELFVKNSKNQSFVDLNSNIDNAIESSNGLSSADMTGHAVALGSKEVDSANTNGDMITDGLHLEKDNVHQGNENVRAKDEQLNFNDLELLKSSASERSSSSPALAEMIMEGSLSTELVHLPGGDDLIFADNKIADKVFEKQKDGIMVGVSPSDDPLKIAEFMSSASTLFVSRVTEEIKNPEGGMKYPVTIDELSSDCPRVLLEQNIHTDDQPSCSLIVGDTSGNSDPLKEDSCKALAQKIDYAFGSFEERFCGDKRNNDENISCDQIEDDMQQCDGKHSGSKTLRIDVVGEGHIESEPEHKTEVTDKRNEVEVLDEAQLHDEVPGEVQLNDTRASSVVICEISSIGDDALNTCKLKGLNDISLCERGGNAESHSDKAEICSDMSSSSLNKDGQQLEDSAKHSIITNTSVFIRSHSPDFDIASPVNFSSTCSYDDSSVDSDYKGRDENDDGSGISRNASPEIVSSPLGQKPNPDVVAMKGFFDSVTFDDSVDGFSPPFVDLSCIQFSQLDKEGKSVPSHYSECDQKVLSNDQLEIEVSSSGSNISTKKRKLSQAEVQENYFKRTKNESPVMFCTEGMPVCDILLKPVPVHDADAPTVSDNVSYLSQAPPSLCSQSLFSQDLEESLLPMTQGRSKERSKAVSGVIEKIKAKLRLKTGSHSGEIGMDEVSSASSDTQKDSLQFPASSGHETEEDAILRRYTSILQELKNIFENDLPGIKTERILTWKKRIVTMESDESLPKTLIAVVGETGAGKSSLLNALLDHANVLPTSGIRACTAVVVQISGNSSSDRYEADIEFLSEQEWMDELQVLLRELTNRNGKVCTQQPDQNSDSIVAWSKIRAVYGRFSDSVTLKQLSQQRTVTRYLGKTKHIVCSSPKEFKQDIDRYIESRDVGLGGDYWPIVKSVKIQIPNCNICRSGAVLIDMPGIGDSNAARNKIAKQCIQDCNAVWVVSSIHRAVDNKTARDLLGEHFRRQMIMDGQYNSISFICTKADLINTSETIRELCLDRCDALTDEISFLEESNSCVTNELGLIKQKIVSYEKNVQILQNEKLKLSSDADELSQAVIEEDEVDEEVTDVLSQLEDRISSKDEALCSTRAELENLKITEADKIKEVNEQLCLLRQKRQHLREICAKARNEYSSRQIQRDFRAGIKDVRRRTQPVAENSGNNIEDGDSDSNGDDDDEIFKAAENLKVFCVSSIEYLKLTEKLRKDGPAEVFQNVEDTGIPALVNYAHTLTKARRQQHAVRLAKSLGRFLFEILCYTSDTGSRDNREREIAQSLFTVHVTRLQETFACTVSKVVQEISNIFQTQLKPKLDLGVQSAVSSAPSTADKWGSKPNADNRAAGGLPWPTYKAATSRNGVFCSPVYGQINFNEDLSGPLYNALTLTWSEIFNIRIYGVLREFKSSILSALVEFCDDLHSALVVISVNSEHLSRIAQQMIASSENRLSIATTQLKDFITQRQRDISRVITPSIQGNMETAYSHCSAERGTGSFNRMRAHMSQHINSLRREMMEDAASGITEQLQQLLTDIESQLENVNRLLIQDLSVLYESLWELSHCELIWNSEFVTDMLALKSQMVSFYEAVGLGQNHPELLIFEKIQMRMASLTTTKSPIATNDAVKKYTKGISPSSLQISQKPLSTKIKSEMTSPSSQSKSTSVLSCAESAIKAEPSYCSVNKGQLTSDDGFMSKISDTLNKNSSSVPLVVRTKFPLSPLQQGQSTNQQAVTYGSKACVVMNHKSGPLIPPGLIAADVKQEFEVIPEQSRKRKSSIHGSIIDLTLDDNPDDETGQKVQKKCRRI